MAGTAYVGIGGEANAESVGWVWLGVGEGAGEGVGYAGCAVVDKTLRTYHTLSTNIISTRCTNTLRPILHNIIPHTITPINFNTLLQSQHLISWQTPTSIT